MTGSVAVPAARPVRSFDTLIVGSGHAGAQAAMSLRQGGFDGSIGLVGEETDPPYERPPLSKEYLSGEKPFDRMLIRPVAFWNDRRIELLQGQRVLRVDASAQAVATETGAAIGYGKLIWATGGFPRRLTCDGSSLRGVHAVRTRADVDALRSELAAARHVVVIGGGYIGLEAAAVLAQAGKSVTLVEAQARLLARVAGPALSGFYEAQHARRGVTIRLGAQVQCLEGSGDRVACVRLAYGESLPAELVVVGIGIAPSVDPLRQAGAAGTDGVDVDGACRTSLPDVYAIGDCARQPNRFADGAAVRIESVQNAIDQAKAAAHDIMGMACPAQAVPWFWSHQYDLKLQTAGIASKADEEIVRGNPESGSFSVAYLRRGSVIAMDCVNSTRDFVAARALVERGATPSTAQLADPDVALKELI